MYDQRLKVFSDTLQLGGLVAVAGSTAGLWLPTSFAILLCGLAVFRICWLEDNIHHDLISADSVPAGYRACRARRQNLLGRLFADEVTDTDCPRLLASQLRIQSHAWAAFAWSLVAGAMLAQATVVAVAVAIVALTMALRNADYFALAQSSVAAGQALPRHLIARRGPLARLAHSSRRSD